MSDIRTEESWSTIGMLKVCGLAAVVCTVIFLPFPEIDLWVADLFYYGDNDFWLRQTAFNRIKNDYVRPGVGIVAVVGLLYYLYRRFTDPPNKIFKLKRWGFFILCVALSTGFVVHAVFKDNWGRARPKQVTEFAGQHQFTPPLIPARECDRNCSFVSGDASLGYVTLALALYATRRRNFWIGVSVASGLGLGLLRMMNGSHFLSDILFSGIITCGMVLILYRWVEEGHWRDDTAGIRKPLRRLRDGLAGLATPGMRARWGRGAVRLRRLLGRIV